MTAYVDRLQHLGKPIVVDWLQAGHARAEPSRDVHFMKRRLDFAQAVLRARTKGRQFDWH